MLKRCLLLSGLSVSILLAGCAGMPGGFEQPTVTVSSFRMLPSNTAVPRFA